MQKDDIDDAIATLNPNRRRESNDSLNMRDTGFDPMTKKEPLIQPVAVDQMRQLGKGLG